MNLTREKLIIDKETISNKEIKAETVLIKPAPFCELLFSFLTGCNKLILIVGIISSICFGLMPSIMAIILGETINSFSKVDITESIINIVYSYLCLSAAILIFGFTFYTS